MTFCFTVYGGPTRSGRGLVAARRWFVLMLPLYLALAGHPALAAASLVAWGGNNSGQTNVPAALTEVVAIAAGGNHNLALKVNGTVVAWGYNYFGETNVPPGLSNVVAIAAGGEQSLALRANGTVTTWGENAQSHPSIPGINWSSIPPGLSNVVAIAAGENHSLALRTNGTVVAWGLDNGGLTAVPSALSNVVAIAAGTAHSLALRGDGTMVAWPDLFPAVTPKLNDIVAIAAGGYHNLALRADGTVMAWDHNSVFGETDAPAGLSNVVAIAAGTYHSLALRADGTVVVWGNETTAPAGLTNVVAVAAGYGHNLALVGTGLPFVTAQPLSRTIYSGKTSTFMSSASGARPLSYQWQFGGINIIGETNALLIVTNAQIEDSGNYRVVVSNAFGSITGRVAQLAVIDAPPVIVVPPTNQVIFPAGSVSFETLADGSWPMFYQWRKDGVDLSDGSKFAGVNSPVLKVSDVQSVDAGAYSVLVSNAFGAATSSSAWLVIQPLVAWGENNLGQISVPAGLTEVVAISAGESHNLALKDDGTVVAWGYNYFGQATVVGLSNIVAIAAGADHSLALRTDGSVVAWGGNDNGQTNIPAGLSNVVAVAAGGSHSLALRGDGTVVAWGENEDGQSTVPQGLTSVVAVAGGWRHSLALRADGTVIAWGDNNAEQTTIPPGLSKVIAIAAGGFQCLALKRDRTVVGWGNETALPSGLTNIVAIAVGADQSLALQADGTVLSWGSEIPILPVLTNVVAIAAGGSHNLALVGSGVPFVIAQPQNRTTYSGKASFFLVSATRVWPLNYQWQFNGTDLPGATNALLIVTNAQVSDAGGYSVAVSDTFGSITSRIANFTVVNAGPAIVVAPTNQVTFPGGSLTFAILADGSQPMFYQWRFGEDDLPGATNSQLTLSGVSSNTVGRYAVTVTNAYGTVTSTGALLTLNPIAAWGDNRFGQTSVPLGLSNVVALAGDEAHSMALRADGTVVVWGLNDSRQTNIPSGLSEVIAIAAGGYHSLALRADGTVAAWGSGYTNVPPDLSNVVAIAAGSDHSLALRSDGTVIAWGSNHDPWFGNYAGQATVPASLSNVVAIAAGTTYSLALRSDGVVVGWGNVTIPSGLSNIMVIAAGAYHCLALQADGAAVFWYNNGVLQDVPSSLTNVVAVAGGFAHSLALHSDGTVTAWDDGDNYFGQSSVPSGLANVMMIAAGGYLSLALVGEEFHTDGSPSVTTPLAQTNYSGESVFLMARASGVPPLTYQWLRNGNAIPGATNSFLSLNHRPSSDGGIYSLMVSNRVGVTVSHGAPVILIDTPPSITLQPTDVSAYWNGSASLEVQAHGSTPLTYQWRFDEIEISGATNATLLLNNLKFAQAGHYSVVVSNAYGTVTSSNAVLRLVPVIVWGDQTAVPTRLSNVVAIAAGGSRTLALQSNGVVVGWDDSGELADIPAAVSNVTAIAAGGGHNLALRADGTVVGWGYNGSGQTTVPASLSNVVVIAAGMAHSLALRADGVVIAWGYNEYGQTNVPVELNNVVAIAAGSTHSLALRSDGTVVTWGDNVHRIPEIPSGLTNIVAIAASGEHNLALRSDGVVVGWSVSYEQSMIVPAGLSNVVAIAASGEVVFSEAHSLALRADGTVVGWGQSLSEHTVPYGLSNMVAIATGSRHSVALISDRPPNSGPPYLVLQPGGQTAYLGQTVNFHAQAVGALPLSYQWQFNGSALPDQTNSSLVLSNLQLDNAGTYFLIVSNSLGVTTTRSVLLKAVDAPPFIQVQPAGVVALRGRTATLRVAANGSTPLTYQWRFEGIEMIGATNSVLVLDGLMESEAGRYSVVVSNRLGAIVSADAIVAVVPVAAWGDNYYGQTNVPADLRGVVAIAAGEYHNLALKSDGRVVAWGDNYFGQLNVPSTLTNVVAIAAGRYHSLALKNNGAVAGWGSGQISVPTLNNVVAIAAGGNQSMALKADGTVAAWGYSADVPATVPVGLKNVVAIAAGAYHSLALLSNGRVVAWGGRVPYNEGQTNVPAQLNDAVAIAAGDFYSIALKSDGTVLGWGGGGAALPGLSNVAAIAAGFSHNLAVKSDGRVIGWGLNLRGELTIPDELGNVVSVAAGRSDSLALIGDGSVVLVTHPVARSVFADSTTRLSVMAVGQGLLTYQWLFNGASIVGATNRILELLNTQTNQSGNYSVLVSNSLGAATSRVAQVLVLVPARVAPLPASTTVLLGSNITLYANAEGTPPLRYQWRKNGANISGATNSSYTISNVQVSDGGAYTVVVKNDYGTATSDPTLLIVEVPPQASGDNFADRVAISGTNGVVGGTNRFATKETGEPNHGGKAGGKSVWYTWHAPTNGIATFRTSGSVFDTLLGIYTGGTVSNLTTIASDEDRGGFFTSEVQFNAVAGTNYHIAVDGFAGAEGEFILSWALEITSDTLPVITNQPISQAVLANSDVIFSVSAVGDGLTYQWFFNDAAIPGATTPTLTRNNVQSADVGSYFVRVRNSVGREVESLAAALELVSQLRPLSQDKLGDLSPQGPGSLAGPHPPKGPALFTVSLGTIDYQIVDNRHSRTEPLEPNPCGVIGGKSQAILLRATSNGMFRIDTIGSAVDTVLTVYTYTNPAYLTAAQVACDNDSAPDGRRSLLWFNATANADYLVIVDGVNYEGGTVHINWAFGLPPSGGTNNLPPRHTFLAGQSLTLRAPATNGIPPPRFQWHWNGSPIAGATNALFTLTNLQSANVGFYTVTASNAIGMVTYSTDIGMEVTSMRAELKLTDKVLRLWLPTVTNQTTVVETSTDLQHWVPVQFYSPQQNNLLDFSITNTAQQFFRTRSITNSPY